MVFSRTFSILLAMLVLAAAPVMTGCGPLPEESLDDNANQTAENDATTDGPETTPDANADATVVELYAPDEVPATGLTLTAGQTVELHWATEALPTDATLVYADLDTGEEVSIAATADTGTATWTVPATLAPDTDYEFRVSAADGTVLATSAPFTVSSVVEPIPSADQQDSTEDAGGCGEDADCDDAVSCNGLETCVDGQCLEGESPCQPGQTCNLETGECESPPCAADTDCAAGETCADGICVETVTEGDDLLGFATDPATGEPIDLAVPLEVGSVVTFEAPNPAPITTRLPRVDCTCSWTVEPAAAGTFTTATECATDFTPIAAGDLTVSVAVTCGGTVANFTQQMTVAEVPSCTEDAECGPDEVCQDGTCAPAPPPAPTITILDEQARPPFVVRFDMRLHDADGQVIPAGVSEDDFRVYEDDVEIDLTETNMFVTPGENLPLRLFLVLDYSASTRADGALASMISAAGEFVQAAHFTATHYVGVVEFHDRTDEGQGFSVAVPLTRTDAAGKAALVAGIPAARSIESGLTRVWDAVDLAIRTLDEQERQVGEVRAIVFLTDGRDTTSETDPIALTSAAQASEVALYPIGFGHVGANEPTLQLMADETGGEYFSAADAASLSQVFAGLAFDLRGQWSLTYVTPSNSGIVNVRIEFDWDGTTTAYETTFDAAAISGDIHQGVIEVADRTYDAAADRTDFALRAAYMPRNVDRLRLQFAHSDATFSLQGRGGLIDGAAGWTLAPLGSGAYLLSGPAALEAGAFGNLGIASVPGDVEKLQVTHDDSVFAAYLQPKTFIFEGDLWAAPYTLAVAVDPEGAGSVTIDPAKSYYGHGEQVTLAAIPAGTVFDHWVGADGGDTTTITITADTTITAVFTDLPAE